MSLKVLPIYLLISLLVVVTPSQAFAADNNVGNEVVDAANTSLTRTGGGTAANPYKLHLNVGNANTWTGTQTYNAAITSAGGFTSTGTFTASGILNANNTVNTNGILNANGALNAYGAINLGDGGDAASLSGTTVTVKTGDNNANSFLVQQGTIKYLQIATTDGSENVAFGNSTTNPTYNFLGSGSASFGGAVTVSGNLTAANWLTTTNFQANGNSVITPSGTSDVTIATDTDSTLVVTGLQTATGDALCLNGSSEVVLCTATGGSTASLQSAYNEGNTINSTDSRDIAFSLTNTATDSNLSVTTAAGSTGYSSFSLANGTNSSAPAQLITVENLDNDETLGSGIRVQSAAGGITTALDLSDAEIATAIALGTNDVNGTNLSIAGSTGNIQTSGDVAVDGGDLTTTASTANLFNTNATTVNIANAATTLTLGANFGSINLRGYSINFQNANSVVAPYAVLIADTLSIGGGYGSTGINISNSGNIQTNGTLSVDGTSTLMGNTTVAGDVAVNGGDVTTTSSTANLFNTAATTVNIGGAATNLSLGSSTGTTTVGSALTAVGLITANGGIIASTGQALTANGSSTFSPNSTNSMTVNTDSDSFLTVTGLQTATGDGLCIDGSNNVVKCSGTPSDVRLKKNISELTNVLPRVLKAQGVKYDLLKEEESAPGEGKNIGFIAQELEVLFPEIVKTDANGIKSVDYEKMTAVLVESTKEQQKQIDELKAEIEALKAAINK